jgi:hypothetical protein
MFNIFMKFSFTLIIAVLVSSCASVPVFKLYKGSELPTDKIAVLSYTYESIRRDLSLMQKNPCNSSLFISSIDGLAPCDTGYTDSLFGGCHARTFGIGHLNIYHIELPPGKHTLSVGYYSDDNYRVIRSLKNQNISFDAEAGKRYELKGEIHFVSNSVNKEGMMQDSSWKAWVEEAK